MKQHQSKIIKENKIENTKERDNQINEILKDYQNNEKEEWYKIPNVLKPPVYCLQTYERANGEYAWIKSESLLAYPVNQFQILIENWHVFKESQPETTLRSRSGQHIVFDVYFPSENKLIQFDNLL